MPLIEISTRRPDTDNAARLNIHRLVPTRADLSLSGQRDASECRLVFENVEEDFNISDLAQTVQVLYGRDTKTALFRWGAADTTVSLQEGRRTVETELIIGPYRYAQETRNSSAFGLYDALIRDSGGSDLVQRLIDAVSVATRAQPDGSTTIYWDGSSEVARWLYLLHGANALALAAVQRAEGGQRDEFDTLLDRIYKYLAGEFNYDDAVRFLFEHFGLLTYIDYSYSDTLGTIGPNPDSATLRNYGTTEAPLHFRAVHDPLPTSPAPPSYASKRFQHDLNLSIRPQENILVQFKFDSEGDTVLRNVEFPRGTPLVPEAAYWMLFQGRLSGLTDIVAKGADTSPLFQQAIDDQTRQVDGITESIRAAWFEGHITQRQIFMPNRTCEATIRAPDTAAELKLLLPGNPVMIDGRGYWITELRVNAETEEAAMELVDPTIVDNDNRAAWMNEIARL